MPQAAAAAPIKSSGKRDSARLQSVAGELVQSVSSYAPTYLQVRSDQTTEVAVFKQMLGLRDRLRQERFAKATRRGGSPVPHPIGRQCSGRAPRSCPLRRFPQAGSSSLLSQLPEQQQRQHMPISGRARASEISRQAVTSPTDCTSIAGTAQRTALFGSQTRLASGHTVEVRRVMTGTGRPFHSFTGFRIGTAIKQELDGLGLPNCNCKLYNEGQLWK